MSNGSNAGVPLGQQMQRLLELEQAVRSIEQQMRQLDELPLHRPDPTVGIQLTDAQGNIANLQAERDRLREQMNDAAERYQSHLSSVQREADEWLALVQAEHEHEIVTLRDQLTDISAERDESAHQLASVLNERDEAIRKLALVQNERDTAARQLALVQNERDAATNQFTIVMNERDVVTQLLTTQAQQAQAYARLLPILQQLPPLLAELEQLSAGAQPSTADTVPPADQTLPTLPTSMEEEQLPIPINVAATPPASPDDTLLDAAIAYLKGAVRIKRDQLQSRFGLDSRDAAALLRRLQERGVIGPRQANASYQVLLPPPVRPADRIANLQVGRPPVTDGEFKPYLIDSRRQLGKRSNDLAASETNARLVFHVPPDAGPDDTLAILNVLSQHSPASVAALCATAQSAYGAGGRSDAYALALAAGLVEREKRSQPPFLSDAGRRLVAASAELQPDLIHYLLYSGWSADQPDRYPLLWTYRTVCNLLWQQGGGKLDNAWLLSAVSQTREDDFAALAAYHQAMLSFSSKSLRGVYVWLERLQPPAIVGRSFQLRVACPLPLLLLALGWVYRDTIAASDDADNLESMELLLNERRREGINQLCLLEPAALDSLLDQLLDAYPNYISEGTRSGTYGRFLRLQRLPRFDDDRFWAN